MASYLSIDKATSTYVELYVTTACMNLISLQATLPACQDTVVFQIISVSTDIKPTNKSAMRYSPSWDDLLQRYYVDVRLWMSRNNVRDNFSNKKEIALIYIYLQNYIRNLRTIVSYKNNVKIIKKKNNIKIKRNNKRIIQR